jgi:hypothetical protein
VYRDSLSNLRLNKAKEFLKSLENFIATQLDLFRATLALSKDTVTISIVENFTGQNGLPATEEKQGLHTDYPVDPSNK